MKLSVIVPTRNHADLWRSGWLSSGLAAQTEPPDELVVALDHTEDNTLAVIRKTWFPFPVRILEVLTPRIGPNPASANPDNCLFAAAGGDIIVHLDDDLSVNPDLCRRLRALLDPGPRAVIWLQLRFVKPDHSPITVSLATDSRLRKAERLHWQMQPGGVLPLSRPAQLHWGGGWAVHRNELLAIGGHCRHLAALRNSDTRLGNRLVRHGLTSYVTCKDELIADHLGPTWYALHRHDRDAIRESRGPSHGATIANGGTPYWTSDTCRNSYRELPTPNPNPRPR